LTMNEDEAFIRAIVDRPGDDTARLVYADWLDDRDDPRGAYLRAEFEWAKPWHSGERPPESPELRKLAAGLDPVWVARVSRPPMGVCCEHLRFKERGPVIDAAEIDQVEQRLGGKFSHDFRAFLLNYNGGTPEPPHLPYPGSVGWTDLDLEIRQFYTASRRGEVFPNGVGDRYGFEFESERDWLEELYEGGGAQMRPNPLIADMAPFGETIHDLGYFLIGIGESNRGRVYHFRDYCHFSDDSGHLFHYAETFAEFLICLRPERDS
jgi:uncharacterized protein (TIGR02996 family)